MGDWVTFMSYSKDDADRVLGMRGALERIATAHQLTFQVRTEEQDPDPEPDEGDENAADPVRLADRVTVPEDVIQELRGLAKSFQVHIYVHHQDGHLT